MPPLHFAILILSVIAAAGATIFMWQWLGLEMGVLAGMALVFSLWLHRRRVGR